MSWEEDPAALASAEAADIVDAVFSISCRALPVDHAWALSAAVADILPWLADQPGAGMHTIHGAESGAGWMRPEGPGERLQISRRAKLVLRLPRSRMPEAAAVLGGRTLDVAGCPLTVGGATLRPLARITTLFSRGVDFESEDEAGFLEAARAALGRLDIRPERAICGRETRMAGPDGERTLRALMVAGLSQGQSIALQRVGLGPARALGCGIFIGHRDIADVRSRDD